ncbi:hypothetical protein HRI_000062800 [Hibiscus trionum]|uniref:Uncharacterized protein n=1 Tax=Hibiscus trionum TaxID=183268 RepID=A0A9W7LHS4_HIBTR|nr:hypothetical protein HRI_000062800 [Hibiscus trionum]
MNSSSFLVTDLSSRHSDRLGFNICCYPHQDASVHRWDRRSEALIVGNHPCQMGDCTMVRGGGDCTMVRGSEAWGTEKSQVSLGGRGSIVTVDEASI